MLYHVRENFRALRAPGPQGVAPAAQEGLPLTSRARLAWAHRADSWGGGHSAGVVPEEVCQSTPPREPCAGSEWCVLARKRRALFGSVSFALWFDYVFALPSRHPSPFRASPDFALPASVFRLRSSR